MTTLTTEEVVKMARQAGFARYMTDGEINWKMFETFAKLVDAKATAREREACGAIEYDLAKSPAMFATMAEYKAYKDGVQEYRTKIIARGEAT
jgi:hypothetical protein